MNWIKKGLIYVPKGDKEWSKTHAQVPFPYKLKNGNIRIFYSTRDDQVRSYTSFIDVEASDPRKIIYIHDKPVLAPGKPGSFDDSGTMPSWFLEKDGKLYAYYIGWNKSPTCSYRLSIGLAVSEDEGLNFKKMFDGPIMDRDITDSVGVASPCVFYENGKWRMWYLSFNNVQIIDGQPENGYNVKYAESKDGINWERNNTVCIDFDHKNGVDAIGKPFVWFENGIYKMFHSNRAISGFRNDSSKSYRIRYSESTDGITWKPKYSEVGIDVSNGGWDSQMIEYPSFYDFDGRRYMLYNGNGFGKSGFGLAVDRDFD